MRWEGWGSGRSQTKHENASANARACASAAAHRSAMRVLDCLHGRRRGVRRRHNAGVAVQDVRIGVRVRLLALCKCGPIKVDRGRAHYANRVVEVVGARRVRGLLRPRRGAPRARLVDAELMQNIEHEALRVVASGVRHANVDPGNVDDPLGDALRDHLIHERVLRRGGDGRTRNVAAELRAGRCERVEGRCRGCRGLHGYGKRGDRGAFLCLVQISLSPEKPGRCVTF